MRTRLELISPALDGKVLRGTIPPEETQEVVLLAAYVPEHGVAVMQVEVEGDEDEAVAAPRVLSVLNLQGVVITGDAMYTERYLEVGGGEKYGDRAETERLICKLPKQLKD